MDLHVSLVGRKDLAGQMYRQLRAAILNGRLRAGEAVPPTRELARRLAVSRNTVAVAYDRLVAEGFLEDAGWVRGRSSWTRVPWSGSVQWPRRCGRGRCGTT